MWSGNWSHTVVFCQLVVLCGLVTVVSHSGLLSAGGPVWSGNWSHTVVFCQLVVLCGLVPGLTQWSSVSWWACVVW